MSSLSTIAAGGLLRNHRRKARWTLLCLTFLLATAAACGPAPSPTPEGPVITFPGPKQIHHQREIVTAHVVPMLTHKEFLQLWVRAGDEQWYPCAAAKQDPSGGWNALCQFGSDKHPASEGTRFVIGAFYTTNRVNSEYLPDSVWYLLKTQQTQPVVFSAGK